MDKDVYLIVAFIVGGLAAITAWIASMFVAGFWGFLLGWIPALIVGFLAGILWPLTILIVGGLILWIISLQ